MIWPASAFSRMSRVVEIESARRKSVVTNRTDGNDEKAREEALFDAVLVVLPEDLVDLAAQFVLGRRVEGRRGVGVRLVIGRALPGLVSFGHGSALAMGPGRRSRPRKLCRRLRGSVLGASPRTTRRRSVAISATVG